MPKLVDYAARFEFLREAAFAIVLDDGPSGLSRQALAHVLGTSLTTVRRLVAPSASLSAIAAQAVERRRAHGRWGIPATGDAHRNAHRLIASVLPATDERVDEELVWLKLLLAHPRLAPPTARLEVGERYQVFDLGWADERRAPEPARDDAAMARAIAEREDFLRHRLQRALSELGVPEDERVASFRRLRTSVDGLTWGVCLGHLTPAECLEQVEELVENLSRLAA
jgi:hypothetical protein